MTEFLLLDIVFIIVSATALAFFARVIKQPLIPAYVIAGVLIGPLGLRLITNTSLITSLAELGIAFLLFIVGLELNFNRLKDIAKTSVTIGITQVLIMLSVGFWIAILLGYNNIEAIYIGLIIAFSSTMVVIKLLADKNELDTLHGRLMLGILLVQDILVIVAMSVLINLGNLTPEILAGTLIKGLGLLAIAVIASRYVLQSVLKFVADSQELLFLVSLSWLFLFAAMAFLSGFSIAIGAFIAGVGLAAFPYNFEIISRMKSLKDFFVTIFFVSLGMEFTAVSGRAVLVPVLVLFAAVVVIKPLATDLLSRLNKYSSRTSFRTSIGLAQTSEFSLILVAQGLALKHVSHELFSIAVIISVLTMTMSSYLIKFDRGLFMRMQSIITRSDYGTHERERLEFIEKKRTKKHIILIGGHRMGHAIIKTLKKLEKEFVVVDFDPEVIKHYIAQGIQCIYGDASDLDILHRINLRDAEMIISTIPSEEDNMLLIDAVRAVNKKAPVIVVAPRVDQALHLYDHGADYVISPRVLSGQKIAETLLHVGRKKKSIKNIRENHIAELQKIEEEQIIERYGPNFLTSLKRKLQDRKGIFRGSNP